MVCRRLHLTLGAVSPVAPSNQLVAGSGRHPLTRRPNLFVPAFYLIRPAAAEQPSVQNCTLRTVQQFQLTLVDAIVAAIVQKTWGRGTYLVIYKVLL